MRWQKRDGKSVDVPRQGPFKDREPEGQYLIQSVGQAYDGVGALELISVLEPGLKDSSAYFLIWPLCAGDPLAKVFRLISERACAPWSAAESQPVSIWDPPVGNHSELSLAATWP